MTCCCFTVSSASSSSACRLPWKPSTAQFIHFYSALIAPLSRCARTCWLRSWLTSNISSAQQQPLERLYLVVVDLRLGAGCWDGGCRVVTDRQSSWCRKAPRKHRAKHDSCCWTPRPANECAQTRERWVEVAAAGAEQHHQGRPLSWRLVTWTRIKTDEGGKSEGKAKVPWNLTHQISDGLAPLHWSVYWFQTYSDS